MPTILALIRKSLIMEIIPIILLGWPSAIIGVLFLISGIVLKNKRFGIIGAIIAMGFCLFTSLYPPPTRWLGISALISNWISALWNWKYKIIWQSLFLLPMILLIIWVAYAVLSQ
jgi:hypothetical protein